MADSNFPVHLIGILIVKRRVASKHLEQKDAERPPVHRVIVANTHYNLWRQVLRRATQRECPVLNLLSETEIRDAKMAIRCNQQVFWFYVSICNL